MPASKFVTTLHTLPKLVGVRKMSAIIGLCLLAMGLPASAFAEPSYSYIWIPWRSQFDGTTYADSNCGPAALGMAMSYYGEWWSTNGIRKSVNTYLGYWGTDGGSTWEALKYAAEIRDFRVYGLYNPDGSYHRWTLDELLEQTNMERPVILLVRYWSLPGHGDEEWWGDHYIVFLGLTPDGRVVYHDPAFSDEFNGSYRLMTQERLIRAWTRTASGLQYTAMAVVWPPAER